MSSRSSAVLSTNSMNSYRFPGFRAYLSRHQGLSPGWSALGGDYIFLRQQGTSFVVLNAESNTIQATMRLIQQFGCRCGRGLPPLALGAEMSGSFSCPASFTSLRSLCPSTGLLSRSGISPASSTSDTPEILAKSPWEIAGLMSMIAVSIQQTQQRTTSCKQMLLAVFPPH
jgi:hypothetical protein